jgi:serine/threonine protein kinase/WD40 repeat protein
LTTSAIGSKLLSKEFGTMSASHELLAGMLALQNDFIDRAALIRAFDAWAIDKRKSIPDYLIEQRALGREERQLLDGLVARFLARHEGDVDRSLAALGSIDAIPADLAQIADADLQATLVPILAAPGNPDAGSQAASGDQSTISYPPATADAGRFRIVRPHAEGGLGRVYVARDLELNREVALKRIKDEHADNPDSRSRFQLEAEITGRLEHPGIVPVYGLGTYDNGRPFYAMRFIRGQSLKEEIERFHGVRSGKTATADSAPSSLAAAPSQFDVGERAVPFRKLLQRFIDICEAVHYAHCRGILHRDLKPGNVMVGRYGETLVVDWGLAKVLEKDAPPEAIETVIVPGVGSGATPTVMGAAVGTPAYMSPEQAAGRLESLGPASDVYSLGATLYAILTGRVPFESSPQGLGELLARVAKGEFPKPRTVHAFVPKPLEAICLKAMATEPAARYASARDLSAEIERYLADEPVHALPDTPADRFHRLARKHRGYVQAGVISLVVIALVSLGANLLINEQKRLAQASAAEEKKAKIRANDLADEKTRLADEKTRLAEEKSQLASAERAARELADQQLRQATAQRLAAQSLALRTENPPRAGLLAIEAVNVTRLKGEGVVPQAREALHAAASSLGGEFIGMNAGVVHDLDLSGDGRWLVSMSDTTLKVWQADSLEFPRVGHELKATPGSGRWYAQFSPNGRWLIATHLSVPQEVYCWDVRAPQFPHDPARVFRCEAGLAGPPRFGFQSADLFVPCRDNRLYHWNIDSTQPVASQSMFPVVHSSIKAPDVPAPTWVFPPVQGRWIATYSPLSMTVAFHPWNAEARRPDPDGFTWPTEWAHLERSLFFCPASDDMSRVGLVMNWDCFTFDAAKWPKSSLRMLDRGTRHTTQHAAAAIHPKGSLFVAGTADGVVKLWDLQNSDVTASPAILVHVQSQPQLMKFSADGRWLALGLQRGSIIVWDTTDFQRTYELTGHGTAVQALCFSPDSRRLMSGSLDGAIRQWDLAASDPQRARWGEKSDRPVHRAFMSPGGKHLVRMFRDVNYTFPTDISDLSKPELPALLFPRGREAHQSYQFSPDGRRVVGFETVNETLPGGNEITLCNLGSASGGRHFDAGFGVGSIAQSADGRWLAAAQSTLRETSSVRVWDLANGGKTTWLLASSGHSDLVGPRKPIPVQFTADNQHLVLGDKDGTIKRFDVENFGAESRPPRVQAIHQSPILALRQIPGRTEFLTVETNFTINRLSWPDLVIRQSSVWAGNYARRGDPLLISANGHRAAMFRIGQSVLVWDLRDGDTLRGPIYLNGHTGEVHSAVFSTDGRWIVTAADDRTIRAWNLESPEPSKDHVVLPGTRAAAKDISVTVDGWIVTILEDGTICRWELDIHQLLTNVRRTAGRDFTPDERVKFQLSEDEDYQVERLAFELRSQIEVGRKMMIRENRRFSFAALHRWQESTSQLLERMLAAQATSDRISVADDIRAAEDQLRAASEIIQIVEADPMIINTLSPDAFRKLIPFRLQQLAVTSRDDELLLSLLTRLESLAGQDGSQFHDCATWAATVAYRMQANQYRSEEF